MNSDPVIRHDQKRLRARSGSKWYATTLGTHWTVAGSVAVIIFGSYVVYRNHDNNQAIATAAATVELAPLPTSSAPFTLEK